MSWELIAKSAEEVSSVVGTSTAGSMCGRARCTLHREEIAQMAGVASDAFVDGDKYRPCENMGPGRYGPVTFRGRDDGAGPGKSKGAKHTKLQAMRWGLIPSFTKPHAKPDHFIMFNARSESLHERPAFRRLLETSRCIIFSDGYYEWRHIDKKEKQPYYLHSTTGPLKFAGLYDSWMNEDGETSYTYTMLTTEAPPQLTWMHPRIPVVLTDEGVGRWLSDAKFDSLRDLLVGYKGDDLKWHPVDKRVGSTKFQSEDCSKKVDIKHAANITAFFGGQAPTNQAPIAEDVSDGASTTRIDSSSVPQAESTKNSKGEYGGATQESQTNRLQEDSVIKPAAAVALPPPVTTSPARAIKSGRMKAFHSPIKFLFEQQQMVQQAEEILAESEGRTTARASTTMANPCPTAPTGTKRPASPSRPRASPKKSKKVQPSPRKSASKPPQRGTLLAYFQPKT